MIADVLVGQTDHGDHRDIMVGGLGAQNVFYSSSGNPIELTGDVDLEFAKQKVSFGVSFVPILSCPVLSSSCHVLVMFLSLTGKNHP